jgi:hypothetical protein
LVLADDDRDLTEVCVARAVGDDEEQQLARDAGFLVGLRDARSVGSWERRHPARRCLILRELERGFEVVWSKRA